MKKKAKEALVLTKEQLLDRKIKDGELSVNALSLPPPTRSFKVEDSVVIGNLEECVIKDISPWGKYYWVEHLVTGRNVPPNTYTTDWWRWFDIFYPNNNKRMFHERATLRYSSMDVGSLINRATSFGINVNNPVQRGDVWSLEDKVALIDSVFNKRDTGRFLFLIKEYPYADEILDGKQRLTAFLEFYLGKFKYKGLYYHELDRLDRYYFMDHSAPVAEVKGLDEAQIIDLFLHINFSGVPQDEAHLNRLRERLETIKQEGV